MKLTGEKIKLLTVCGPTASGKTRLAVDLAEILGGEIVGADSMQIYKGMSIGTAKPSPEEMRGVPHHLIDFLEPDKSFSVADYVRIAREIISDIHSRGRLPVVTGGTGLYISSLIDGINFEETASDEKLRAELHTVATEKGGEYLLEELRRCDPELAAKLHPNNTGRVIRALEVFRLTGQTMTEHQVRSRQTQSDYEPIMFGLCFENREKLYERINLRVEAMLEQGILEEAKKLFNEGLSGTAVQAIGYKEFFKYFTGEESIAEAVENLKRETRRYAKRQLTWLKRDKRIQWLFVDKYTGYEDMLDEAVKIVRIFFKGTN